MKRTHHMKRKTRIKPVHPQRQKVILGAKGRVVIPASVRRALGLKEGDSLAVSVEGTRLVLASRRARLDALETELGSMLKKTPRRRYSEELDRERDEGARAEDRA